LEKAAQLDAESDRQSVIENTIAAYNNLYKAQKAVELVNENMRQEKQRVSDFSNLEQNGLLARNDLLKAELAESNIELSLLDAQNNLNITIINMDLMLGLPEETVLSANTDDLSYPDDAGTIATWEQQALQNRKDIAAIDFRHKAAVAGVKSAKGEYYPSVALTGGYIAADIPNLLTITNALNGGVGVSYNFGALYKTGAKVAQAKAQMHELEANRDMMLDNVHVQINQAYQNFLVSKKKIEVYQKAIDQANENYKITKNKYDNSLATTTDLLDADVAQLQAKLNLAYAKGDALVAYKKLQQTAGVLNYDQHLTK
jgi:outer membrane protein TolC